MSATLVENVYLIGFMGAGKSSVASCLARRLGLACLDTDVLVEQDQGRSIAQIFAQDGEAAFRTLETKLLKRLANGEPALVSCGGGIVQRSENIGLMSRSGYIVLLQVSPEEAFARIGCDPARPLSADLDTLRMRYGGRVDAYEQACDARIDTSGRTPVELALELCELLLEAGVLHMEDGA